MREPLQQSSTDPYERPNQSWICGLEDSNGPCPFGPTDRGNCPGGAACHPVREGDRWRCNRTHLRGGDCPEGPSPEGECCLVYQCTPRRSLRLIRARFVTASTLAALGAICMMLSADWRNEVLDPGGLSVHHAQLLQRGDQTKQCASCHAAGSESLGQWIQASFSLSDPQPSQTELCLECHRHQIDPPAALWAHNVDPKTLSVDDKGPGTTTGHRRDPLEPIACAACHREHQGHEHDLTWMSNVSCQACHQQRYDGFATDHPQFDRWPAQRRTRIAFDHAAHELKHFPEQKHQYECSLCHLADSSGAFQQTLDYAATCAGCHDSKIATSWDKGLLLFALPMLNLDAFQQSGHDIGRWPDEATGDFDGALPIVMKLLLATDAPEALAVLGANFDFFDVDPDDDQQLQAAAELVWESKRLLHDVTQQGHRAIGTRVEALLGRELKTDELAALVAHVSPDTLSTISARWLPWLDEELAQGNSPNIRAQVAPDEGPAVGLPNSGDRERISAGGWLRDELALAIQYRPIGHADPYFTAWLNIAAEAATGPQAELIEPLLRAWLKPTAPGLCGSCHSVDRTADGRRMIQWRPAEPLDAQHGFTRFSHQPHLLQPQLRDCTACHRPDPEAQVMASYAGADPLVFEPGFLPITKQSCADCHTARAVGDSCQQCHRYHVGASKALLLRRAIR